MHLLTGTQLCHHVVHAVLVLRCMQWLVVVRVLAASGDVAKARLLLFGFLNGST